MIARRRTIALLFSLLALAVAPVVGADAAEAAPLFGPDAAFGDAGTTVVRSASKGRTITINAIAARPGGGWIGVGNTDSASRDRERFSDYRWSILAFGRDGKLDGRFGNRGQLTDLDPGRLADRGSVADVVAVQPDGKILVGGIVDVATAKDADEYWKSVGGNPECSCDAVRGAFLVARFHADGKLDRTFGTRGHTVLRDINQTWLENAYDANLKQIVVAPNGRIYVMGDSRYYTSPMANHRSLMIGYGLRKDGSIDRSFGSNGRMLAAIGPRGHSFSADKYVWLKGGGIAASGTTITSPGAHVDHMVTARVTAAGRLDRRYGGQGWREVSLAPVKTSVASVEFDSSGAATYLLQRYRGKYADRGEPTGVFAAKLDKRGRFDRTFGSNGVVDLTKKLGNGHLGASGMVQFKDGSMLVKTWTGKYDDGLPGAIFSISKSGAVGAPYSVAFERVPYAGDAAGHMTADGTGVVFTGYVELSDDKYAAFIARMKPVSP